MCRCGYDVLNVSLSNRTLKHRVYFFPICTESPSTSENEMIEEKKKTSKMKPNRKTKLIFIEWLNLFPIVSSLRAASSSLLIRYIFSLVFCLSLSLSLPLSCRWTMCADTDEMSQGESNHYDYGGSQTQQKASHPKPINTLNTINSVLLRKTSLNKLSR